MIFTSCQAHFHFKKSRDPIGYFSPRGVRFFFFRRQTVTECTDSVADWRIQTGDVCLFVQKLCGKKPFVPILRIRVVVPKGKSSIHMNGKFSKPMNSHKGYIPRKPEWASLKDFNPKTK